MKKELKNLKEFLVVKLEFFIKANHLVKTNYLETNKEEDNLQLYVLKIVNL